MTTVLLPMSPPPLAPQHPSSLLALACSLGVWGAEEQKPGVGRVQVSWGLGSRLTHCHFCLLLLAKAGHEAGPDSGGGAKDFISWWEELRGPIAEDMDTGRGGRLGPLLQSVYHSHPEKSARILLRRNKSLFSSLKCLVSPANQRKLNMRNHCEKVKWSINQSYKKPGF